MKPPIQKSRQLCLLFASLLAIGCPAVNAVPVNASTLYSNDFDSAEFVLAGVTATFDSGSATRATIGSVQGFALDGFSGNMVISDGVASSAARLLLSNLPEHDSISVSFLLGLINSWDGTTNALAPSTAPDFFNVSVDGVSVFSETFRNIEDDPNSPQSFDPPPGALLSIDNERWFNVAPNPPIVDAAYDLGFVSSLQAIPHTAATAEILFFANGSGWQPNEVLRGDWDEAWGIENLALSISVVPEPTSCLSFCWAAFALWVCKRRLLQL
mgnify:CR=1 FL=1